MWHEREWMVALALWVTPAIGFGQWEATIDLNVDGANWVDAQPGESFTMAVGIESNEPISGIQFKLTSYTGDFMGAFDASDLDSYGSLINKGVLPVSNLYSIGDVSSKMSTTPVSLAGLPPELVFRNEGETGSQDMGIFPGSLLHYTITAPTTGRHGQYLSVSDAILTNSQGSIGLGSGLALKELMIIPEPGSGLLLLAALPLLWRRRALGG